MTLPPSADVDDQSARPSSQSKTYVREISLAYRGEATVKKRRHKSPNHSPSNTQEISAKRLNGNIVIALELLHGTNTGVGRRVPHHRRVNSQISVIKFAIRLAALHEPVHAIPHIGREIPVVGVEPQGFLDDGNSFLLAHVVDLVEYVLPFAVGRQGLEHLVRDLVAPVALAHAGVGVFFRVWAGRRDALVSGLYLLSHDGDGGAGKW